MNLLHAFLAQAVQRPQQIALHRGLHERIRYDTLAQHSAALAAQWHALGLRPGHAVLCALPLGIPLYVALLALLRLGAVAVFPPQGRGIAGLRFCAQQLRPQALLLPSRPWAWLAQLFPELRAIPRDLYPHVAPHTPSLPVAELPETAPAVISFTSGSTGNPKAISRSHGFLQAQHQQLCTVLQPEPGAVELTTLPLFILSNLASGMTSVLPDTHLHHPNLRRLEQPIIAHTVTRLLLPPALYARLAHTTPYWRQFTHLATGGGPVYPDLLQRLAQLAPRARLTAVYGASEAEPIAHLDYHAIQPADFTAMQYGAGLLAGQLAPATQLRLVDDEIWVSGPQVVRSYLNAADNIGTKVLADGQIWHRTGDAGCWDTQGRLWLWGRHAAGCQGTYPFQVEIPAQQLPSVRKAAFVCVDNHGILALEGQRGPLPDWTQRWHVVWLRQIPLDARHGSKVDYPRLRALLSPHLTRQTQ